MKLGIHLHVAGLSLSDTISILDKFGVQRCRATVHNWVQKASLQPLDGKRPTHVAIDETVIQINNRRFWLYAAVDPPINHLLHVRLFQTLATQLTLPFLRELRAKQPVEHATFLVDGAPHPRTALDRLGPGFRVDRYGRWNVDRYGRRNAVERIFREVKRRTSSVANAFRNATLDTAESWLQAFTVWHNRCQS